MKYLAIFIVFIFAVSIVKAQTSNPTLYNYKQKRLYDTLTMLFPDLQTNKEIPYNNNMLVVPLKNEGIKVGSNSRGDVYSMQTDNMTLLKPFKTKDEISNTIKRTKPLLAGPDEKH